MDEAFLLVSACRHAVRTISYRALRSWRVVSEDSLNLLSSRSEFLGSALSKELAVDELSKLVSGIKLPSKQSHHKSPRPPLNKLRLPADCLFSQSFQHTAKFSIGHNACPNGTISGIPYRLLLRIAREIMRNFTQNYAEVLLPRVSALVSARFRATIATAIVLILFAPHAFVFQCQGRPSKLPSLLVFPMISTDFTPTPSVPFASNALLVWQYSKQLKG